MNPEEILILVYSTTAAVLIEVVSESENHQFLYTIIIAHCSLHSCLT